MKAKRIGPVVGLTALGFLLGDNYGCTRVDHRPAAPVLGSSRVEQTRDDESPSPVVRTSIRSGRSSRETDEAAFNVGEGRRLAAYRQLTVPERPEIARYVRYFSVDAKGRATFSVWLRRASRYVGMIRRHLTDHGLPERLLAVALIESGLDPNAVSNAGATGMWQFIQETARLYQLRIDGELDERRDPERATVAAARHLRDLYGTFGDWPLALAAYNAGVGRVQQVAAEAQSRDFWTMVRRAETMPEETASYVPKVLAVVRILSNLEQHGFEKLETLPEETVGRVPALPGQPLGRLASALGIELRELRELNPAMVGGRVPSTLGSHEVAVPSARKRAAELLITGEGASDQALMKELSRIVRGVRVPRPGGLCRFGSCLPADDREGWDRLLHVLGEKGLATYRVQKGDTLQAVADAFGVDAQRLMEANRVKDARRIQVGQLLRVPSG